MQIVKMEIKSYQLEKKIECEQEEIKKLFMIKVTFIFR